MKHISLLLLVLISSCKKDPIEDLLPGNSSYLGQQSQGDIRTVTLYKTEEFIEDFVPMPGDPCYTDMARLSCSNRLDWFMSTKNCPADQNYAGLKDLNKCIWNAWTGYGFWTKNMAFRADALRVEDGHLILKAYKNPKYNPNAAKKCGDQITADPNNEFAQSTNCPWITGGVDSKFASGHVGQNALYGRIEMRAKYVPKAANLGSYPAFWMWPNDIGKGSPYAPTSADLVDAGGGNMRPRVIGEIDILEHDSGRAMPTYGFQTYHNWEQGKEGSANKGTGHLYNMLEYKIYGVEWREDKILWYIDNSIIQTIKAGDLSTAGRKNVPLRISDTASFIMINLGTGMGKSPSDLMDDELHVDWIKVWK